MINYLLNLWNNRESLKLGGATRSPQWTKVRAEHLKKNPTCAVCGKKGNMLSPNEAHHCTPFHLDKSLELSLDNLITLCRDHHLFIGHLMNFKSYNKDVRTDSEVFLNKIKNRP